MIYESKFVYDNFEINGMLNRTLQCLASLEHLGKYYRYNPRFYEVLISYEAGKHISADDYSDAMYTVKVMEKIRPRKDTDREKRDNYIINLIKAIKHERKKRNESRKANRRNKRSAA